MPASEISCDALLEAVRALPAAPRVLAQIVSLLGDANADLDELAQLLRRDIALTARIIRVSNSVHYNVGAPHASLEEAVARVGFAEIFRLIGFMTAAQLADECLPFYGMKGTELRDNSLLSALIAEALAADVKINPRLAYTAGLLRSVGKIALDRVAQATGWPGGSGLPDNAPLLARETELAGSGNCEVAALILWEWRFPAVTVEAIRLHYLVGSAAPPLAYVLNIAAGMAERCGFALVGETRYVGIPTTSYEALGVSAAQVEDAVVRAFEIFYRIREATAR